MLKKKKQCFKCSLWRAHEEPPFVPRLSSGWLPCGRAQDKLLAFMFKLKRDNFSSSLFEVPTRRLELLRLIPTASETATFTNFATWALIKKSSNKLELFLCGWRDSNPHASRHQILSLARLPITPHPHVFYWTANIAILSILHIVFYFFCLITFSAIYSLKKRTKIVPYS